MGWRISDLQDANVPLAGSELLELEQSGSSRKVRLVDLLPGFENTLSADLANNTDPTKGASLMGYRGRTLSKKLEERIDVTDYWLAIDIDWSNAIERAQAVAVAAYNAGTQPGRAPVIFFPRLTAPFSGAYGISRTIHSTLPLRYDGDSVMIYALPGFTGKTVSLFGGGTAVDKSMFLFLNGLRGDLAGIVRHGPRVGKGLVLDGRDLVDRNIYIERMPYAEIDCSCQFSAQDGIVVGPNNWGMSMKDTVVGNFTRYGISMLYNAALNGSKFENIRVWGEFKEGVAGLVFALDAECNSLQVTGFIEKLQYGVIMSGGNGPMSFRCDFEWCRLGCLRVVGDPAKPKVGPIILESCYLHSTEFAKVYADHANVIVKGCRSAGPVDDFATDLEGRGLIRVSSHTNIVGTNATVTAGSNCIVAESSSTGTLTRNYKPHKTNAFVPGWELKNYQFKDAPALQSSGLTFISNYAGGGTGQYVGMSDWWVSEYQHIANPNVLTRKVGVRLANDAGQNAFRPITTGVMSCGEPSALWTQVYAQTATISTSDENAKESITDIEGRILDAWARVDYYQYKFKNAIEEKGYDKARWHFGVIAQRVKEAFESEGLDAFRCGILCYDEWGELWEDVPEQTEPVLTTEPTPAIDLKTKEAILHHDGSQVMLPPGQLIVGEDGQPLMRVVEPAHRIMVREAGSAYGVRYEEALALEAALMRREMAKLKAQLGQ